jgi:hypothetical protein
MDIFRASKSGDVQLVKEQIDKAKQLRLSIADCVDDVGRTACFYAELFGHEEVVELLVRNGWTKMAEGNLFTTSTGRVCFWNDPKLPRGRRSMPAPMRLASANPPVERRSAQVVELPMKKKQTVSTKKTQVAARKAARAIARAAADTRPKPAAPSIWAPTEPKPTKGVRRPTIDASDLHEVGIVQTRVFGGFKRQVLGTRLKTGASSLVTASWLAAKPEWSPAADTYARLAAEGREEAGNYQHELDKWHSECCAAPGEDEIASDKIVAEELTPSRIAAEDLAADSELGEKWMFVPAPMVDAGADEGGVPSSPSELSLADAAEWEEARLLVV